MKIPGFVDLQVNGYKGVDFSDPNLTEDSYIRVCRMLINNGTSAFLPTVITSPEDVYEKNLTLMANVHDMPEFTGHLPGFHIEGPFISSETGACGVHNCKWIREPDITFLDKLIAWSHGKIKLMTVARRDQKYRGDHTVRCP